LKAVLPAMARRSAVLEMLETAIVCDVCGGGGEGIWRWKREVDEIKSSEASGWRGMRVEDCAVRRAVVRKS
jgi:hypothetical protein